MEDKKINVRLVFSLSEEIMAERKMQGLPVFKRYEIIPDPYSGEGNLDVSLTPAQVESLKRRVKHGVKWHPNKGEYLLFFNLGGELENFPDSYEGIVNAIIYQLQQENSRIKKEKQSWEEEARRLMEKYEKWEKLVEKIKESLKFLQKMIEGIEVREENHLIKEEMAAIRQKIRDFEQIVDSSFY